tara:strand:- start:188 stop:868 length:681 start_codon:yes stop_codon:yes gene_type:complete
MKANTPTQTQPPINTPPIPPSLKTKNNSKTIIFLSLLTIASLAISGLLYIQNQQLKQVKNIAKTESQITAPTPKPTTDPTANWITYTVPPLEDYSGPLKINDSNYIRYQIKYPSNWQIIKDSSSRPDPSQISLNNSSGDHLDFYLHSDPSGEISNLVKQGFVYDSTFISLMMGQKYSSSLDNPSTVFIYLKLPEGQTFRINFYNKNRDPLVSQDLDQILSTFKFLN